MRRPINDPPPAQDGRRRNKSLKWYALFAAPPCDCTVTILRSPHAVQVTHMDVDQDMNDANDIGEASFADIKTVDNPSTAVVLHEDKQYYPEASEGISAF